MRNLVKMMFVLFIVCGTAAGSLAVVNMATQDRIARQEKQQKEDALRTILQDADEFNELAADSIWEAKRNGRKLGNAFLAKIQGYSGVITLMFAVDARGVITGLQILGHTETPGLGAKITSEAFRNQFKNKRMEQLVLKKDDPVKGQIDAITGATISSRVVTKALHSTLDSFNREEGERTNEPER